uniref:Myelin protein zero like 2 n=1 Tax=Cyprinus carpio TaxID=7962 RepID=A0A8C1YJG9_CYPCA
CVHVWVCESKGGVCVCAGWRCVSGIRVFTAGDVTAVNGTDVRLKCTFQSSAAIRASSVAVSWTFRPLGSGHEETVFYYQERPFAPSEGRFKKKVEWAGDISGRDASVVLRRVPFSFNGTFSCQVKNPPDVHGNVGVVRLQVVRTGDFSENKTYDYLIFRHLHWKNRQKYWGRPSFCCSVITRFNKSYFQLFLVFWSRDVMSVLGFCFMFM